MSEATEGVVFVDAGPPRVFGRAREYPAGALDEESALERAKADALADYEREKAKALEEAAIRLGPPELLWHVNTRLMRAPYFMCSMAWTAKEITDVHS